MLNQVKMNLEFVDVDGNNRQIGRTLYESNEHFIAVAEDYLTSGLTAAQVCRKHNIGNQTNVDAAFRDGPGQAYMIKRIIEDGLTPHPQFLSYRSGRRIKDQLEMRGYGHLAEGDPIAANVEAEPIPVSDQIAAEDRTPRPPAVTTDPTPDCESDWVKSMNDQLDEIDAKISALEAYREAVEKVKAAFNKSV